MQYLLRLSILMNVSQHLQISCFSVVSNTPHISFLIRIVSVMVPLHDGQNMSKSDAICVALLKKESIDSPCFCVISKNLLHNWALFAGVTAICFMTSSASWGDSDAQVPCRYLASIRRCRSDVQNNLMWPTASASDHLFSFIYPSGIYQVHLLQILVAVACAVLALSISATWRALAAWLHPAIHHLLLHGGGACPCVHWHWVFVD